MEPLAPPGIDAGHIADDEGNRYLYTNQGKSLRISRDGLKAETAPQVAYDGWPIPHHMAIECICLESPKLYKRGESCVASILSVTPYASDFNTSRDCSILLTALDS